MGIIKRYTDEPLFDFWKMHIYRRIREKKKDKLYKDKRKNFCRISGK